MQKLRIPSQKGSNVLKFSPKPSPKSAVSFEEFLRAGNARIIRVSDPQSPAESLRPFQILDFRMPKRAG
jgi:hypothetical protein